MKPTVSKAPASRQLSGELRQRVLDLRRTHSLRRVAELTELPLGTVKTLCSRSGAFRDNPGHRAMFTLPPIKESLNTEVSVPQLPPQQVVTGDKEVDAVLWLHSVIRTGQAALIEKAMKAAARIKTPLKELEKRYTAYLVKAHPGSLFAAMSSFGFSDLESMAKRSVEKLARRQEANARFGEEIFANTPAEQFCEDALAGVDDGENGWNLDEKQVDSVFDGHLALLPHTLSDCLHELTYWNALYFLRHATADCGDSSKEVQARDDFIFRRLALIRARTATEAVAVFRYLSESDRMDRAETESILLNLIGACGRNETL